MGKFEEKKQELLEAVDNKSDRKVFSIAGFNKLGTALLNDPDYVAKVSVTKNGELQEQDTTPVADLRKKMIGDVLKAAGHDADEQEKFVKEYQYPTLPLHGVISEMLTEYMDTGKPFVFNRKNDMKASILIEKQPEVVKEVKSPSTGEVKKKRYSEYRKMKTKSTCPSNLRSDV